MSIRFEYDFGDGDCVQKPYCHEVDDREVKEDILKLIKNGRFDVKDLLDFIDENNDLQDFVDSHYIYEDLKRKYLAEARSDYRDLD